MILHKVKNTKIPKKYVGLCFSLFWTKYINLCCEVIKFLNIIKSTLINSYYNNTDTYHLIKNIWKLNIILNTSFLINAYHSLNLKDCSTIIIFWKNFKIISFENSKSLAESIILNKNLLNSYSNLKKNKKCKKKNKMPK